MYKKKEKRKGLHPLGRLLFPLAQPHHVAQQPRPAAVPAPADMWGSRVGPTRPGGVFNLHPIRMGRAPPHRFSCARASKIALDL